MLVNRQDIDDEKWNTFVERSPQGYIYHYTWYLDVVCRDWKAIIVKNNQEWLAVMPLNIRKKWGISYVLQPPLTQFLGILFKPQDSKMEKTLADKKDWVTEILNYIPKQIKLFNYNFSPDFDYPLPFYWQKYQLFTRYNYELDLSIGMDKLIENLHTRTRNQIKKAQKEQEIKIQISSDIELLTNLYAKTNRTFINPQTLSLLTHLYTKAHSIDKAVLLTAHYQNKVLTGGVFMKYKTHWINLYSSVNTYQETQKRPAEILLWTAIQMAIESGATCFDFEGSMIEGVERFYRKFGGTPVPYLNIQKNSIPLLTWLNK